MKSFFLTPEQRYHKRMARNARWHKPITNGKERAAAYVNMLLVDHGIIRMFYLNLHKVTPHFWRSAQPAPHHIKKLAAKGLKTILYLRAGHEFGSWPLEREACEKYGITLIESPLYSREAPEKPDVLNLIEKLEHIKYPVLVHCKSGADRAGLMSVLFLIIVEQRPVDEAMKHLSLRYGHFSKGKTGILDAFFLSFRENGEKKGIGFREWVENIYEPTQLYAEFKTGYWSNLIVDNLLHRE